MDERASSDGSYELSGYRYKGKEWRDVEQGAPPPRGKSWDKVDLVTINLAPDTEDGFYRSASVFGGLDYAPGHPRYNFLQTDDELYTLDDLAFELALEYGFAAQ